MIKTETHQIGETTILKILESRLGADRANDFKEVVGKYVQEDKTCLVIDLSELTFMDSSGLGALVSLLKIVGKHGGIAIAGPQAAVQALFRLTRMDKVFRIFPAVSPAVEALNASVHAQR
jgi:anti-sigma B factor antagonist